MARLTRFLVAVLVLVLSGSGAALSQQATPVTEAAPAWLVIQAFDAATLSPRTTTGDSTLTLTDVPAMALAFSDRPDRLVAQLSTADFVQTVVDEQADPLNATLVAPLSDGGETMVVVELLDAAHDEAADTVTYQVTVLAAEDEDLTAEAATPLAAQEAEVVFGPGQLFVDDVQTPVKVPVNICGNSVGPIGLLTPAMRNTCVND